MSLISDDQGRSFLEFVDEDVVDSFGNVTAIGNGAAFTFTGSDRFEANDHGPTAVTSTFSLTAMVNIVPNTGGYIVAKGNADFSVRSFSLFYSTFRNQLRMFYGTSAGNQVASFDVVLDDGDWHEVALSVEARNATLFVDGVVVSSVLLTGDVVDCGAPSSDCRLYLAQRPPSNFGLTGSLASVRLYPDAALGNDFPALPVDGKFSLTIATHRHLSRCSQLRRSE